MATITEQVPETVETDVFARIGRFFDALRAGQAAARDYEQLGRLSDDALARKGMTRADAVRRVMENHFG